MSKVQIDKKALDKMMDRLRVLDALEAGGVDNWDGYEFALEELNAELKRREKLEELAQSILEELSQAENYSLESIGESYQTALLFYDSAFEVIVSRLEDSGLLK